jgi:hypothetical protein
MFLFSWQGGEMSLIGSQIAQYEQKARTKYLSAVQRIDNVPLPGWFNDFLEQDVLPLLVRVGFDRQIAESIFRISASAWEFLGYSTAPKLRLHPVLIKYISGIRQDVVFRPTNWIVLPRAHSFLSKKDSLCLIVYLQHLNRDDNLAYEKILLRILIEFIANYSLKFTKSTLAEKQAHEVIFYGYAAMFWKNLQRPPFGLEDLLIFKNYLYWAKAYQKRMASKDHEKDSVIAEMEKMENKILPDQNARIFIFMKNRDVGDLHITLRHGRPGIKHAVNHFTENNKLMCDCSDDHLSCRKLSRQINILFRELRNNYDHETPRTREFIQVFLMELSEAYHPNLVSPKLSKRNTPDNLTFSRRRMARIVKDFRQSLH